MERMLNTEQALKILKECYLTDSVQTLRKWIREGRIAVTGSSFRQGGYKIKAEDLKVFIEERPGLLEILHVYHEVNNNLPIKVTSFFDQLEDKTSDPTATASETTDSCLEKLDVIPERNLPEEERGVRDLHTVIENLNKTVSELMKQQEIMKHQLEQIIEDTKQEKIVELIQQAVIAQPKINKKVGGGAHKAKSKEEFVSFLRKNFWNANSANQKLKGEKRKKFNEESGNCYSLFYDEHGLFRDGELRVENGGYEMKTGGDSKEVIIKGRDRKELVGQYFEVVVLPKIKEQSVINQKTSTFSDEQEQLSLFNNDVNQDDEGYREYIDLKHKE